MASTALVEAVSGSDTAWLLISTALVLLMTPGLAFFYGGLVRRNNVLNTMMMCIIAMGAVPIPWCLAGFSLAFGSGGGRFIGDLSFAGFAGMETMTWPGTGVPALLFAAFQMTFNIIGAAIISGAVVERMRFSAFAVFIVIWSLVVYAPVCHWVWGPEGWIEALGAKDFAGGVVVHETTSVSALVLAILLGPRRDLSEGPKAQPHNVPFVVLGAMLLWFGWSGFNAGSALASNGVASLAMINTYLSASASLLVWALIERTRDRRLSTVGTVTGAVVGLVIITPAAGFVMPLYAIVMGALGCALAYPAFCVSHRFADDTLDCFPCHGVSGCIGTLLTGIFASEGGLVHGGGFRLLGAQLVAALVPSLYAAVVSALIFLAMSLVMRMRVTADDETIGLDDSVHGEKAYCLRPSVTASELMTSISVTSTIAEASSASTTEDDEEACRAGSGAQQQDDQVEEQHSSSSSERLGVAGALDQDPAECTL